MTWSIVEGDCVERMAAMEPCSVDAVVCDPPYLLTFMGRGWDHAPTPAEGQAIHLRWSREALRVLKPGGHLLAFGGTRTYHRLACAIEDAGFEIRDTIAWLYGSGFPKSLDVSKAIDKHSGAEVVTRPRFNTAGDVGEGNARDGYDDFTSHVARTPDAERWQGWGTALKPAHEPIVLARKPLAGNVAQTVLEHGTGALNVDGCRIDATDKATFPAGVVSDTEVVFGNGMGRYADRARPDDANPSGRWPANVVMDPEVAAMLDAQTGTLHAPVSNGSSTPGMYTPGPMEQRPTYGDSGGASRFFYVAKASSAERNAGLDGFEAKVTRVVNNQDAQRCEECGRTHPNGVRECCGPLVVVEVANPPRTNVHPTVKPIDLMRWLVRLVTPPGGLVLDPFTGSGTTGCAAMLEGFRFVGIEREPEAAAIARARIAWWAARGAGISTEAALRAGGYGDLMESLGQGDLFGDAG